MANHAEIDETTQGVICETAQARGQRAYSPRILAQQRRRRLFDEIVEEQNIRRVPKHRWDCAVRLAGDDDFENFRGCRKVLHESVRCIERQGLYFCKMFEDWKDIFFRRTERSFEA